MANLSTISQGMLNGAEAINNNFLALNAALDGKLDGSDNASTGWKDATILNTNLCSNARYLTLTVNNVQITFLVFNVTARNKNAWSGADNIISVPGISGAAIVSGVVQPYKDGQISYAVSGGNITSQLIQSISEDPTSWWQTLILING